MAKSFRDSLFRSKKRVEPEDEEEGAEYTDLEGGEAPAAAISGGGGEAPPAAGADDDDELRRRGDDLMFAVIAFLVCIACMVVIGIINLKEGLTAFPPEAAAEGVGLMAAAGAAVTAAAVAMLAGFFLCCCCCGRKEAL